mmetsp:Transcript_46263/g.83361  ORF Transcript_46263/g.83361 Transcript_46263/m.83361 type:complete len:1063 (-) Transcript_46263:254-3442(-)
MRPTRGISFAHAVFLFRVAENLRDDDTQYLLETEEGQSRSKSQSALQSILATAGEVFASAEHIEKRAKAAALPLVQDLEGVGISLEEHFKLFVMHGVLQEELKPSKASLLELGPPLEIPDGDEELEVICNHNVEERLAEFNFGDAGAFEQGDIKTRVKHVEAYRTYCILSADASGMEDNDLRGTEEFLKQSKESDMQLRGINDAGVVQLSGLTEVLQGDGASGQDKLLRKRLRAMITRTLMPWQSAPGNKMDAIRSIYLAALDMDRKLAATREFFRDQQRIDWSSVQPAAVGALPTRVFKFAESTAKQGAGYIGLFAAKVGEKGRDIHAMIKSLWDRFNEYLHNMEQKCDEYASAQNEKAYTKEGLPQNAAQMSELMEGDLDGAVERASKVMGDVAEANQNVKIDQKAVPRLSRHFEEEEFDDARQGDLDALQKKCTEVEEAKKKIQETASKFCKKRSGNAMAALKQSFTKIARALKDATKAATMATLPALATRGIAVQVGPLSGGLEEVADFQNLEIAQFGWGAGFVGTSMLGAGIGGYAGIAWKGYKDGWNLQDAVQTSLWTAVSLRSSIPLAFGMQAGIGITVATDADNSLPGPWIPEPHGINGVTFGVSATASLSGMVLPFNEDWGAALYHMYNSECFDDISLFRKHLWMPTCKRCDTVLEHSAIASLRGRIHLGGMPLIANLVFSTLATVYHRAHKQIEPDYKRSCSIDSVNNLKDPKGLARIAAKQLRENAVMIPKLMEEFRHMMTQFHFIGREEWANMRKSSELKKLVDVASQSGIYCPDGASDTQGSGWKEHSVTGMTKDMRIHLCHELNLKPSCESDPERVQVSRLLLYDELLIGCVDTEQVNALTALVRQVGQTKTANEISAWFAGCGQSSWKGRQKPEKCCRSQEVVEILRDSLPEAELERLSSEKAGSLTGSANSQHKEFKAGRLIVSMGGGTLQSASAGYAFGTCISNGDCGKNMECKEKVYKRQCTCKSGFCAVKISERGVYKEGRSPDYHYSFEHRNHCEPGFSLGKDIRIDDFFRHFIRGVRNELMARAVSIGYLYGELLNFLESK